MKGKVTASKLNVRSLPNVNSAKIGLLSFDTIVDIEDEIDEWLQIRHNGGFGFVHGDFVEALPPAEPVKGKVTAGVLNVRDKPGLEGEKIGSLTKSTVVEIKEEVGEWYAIDFNQGLGFLHGDFVQILEAEEPQQGIVTVGVLNVRKQPAKTAALAGSLQRNSIVPIVTKVGEWYEIEFNNSLAYVFGRFVDVLGEDVEQPETPTTFPFFFMDTSLQRVKLEPAEKLPIAGTLKEKQAARTWNSYGNLLERLSKSARIDKGSAVAVLNVESSGSGFGADNRMIIRFENHKFWSYWGKHNPNVFNLHFKFRKDKVWLGHEFRETSESEWIKMHVRNGQALEWQVLNFARALDDTAALKSISMGAPQIMGSNFERIGYGSVQKMFENFEKDIRYHIFGLFDFFDDTMKRALRQKDFVTFAAGYNGTGKAEDYGGKIKEQFEIFKNLMA